MAGMKRPFSTRDFGLGLRMVLLLVGVIGLYLLIAAGLVALAIVRPGWVWPYEIGLAAIVIGATVARYRSASGLMLSATSAHPSRAASSLTRFRVSRGGTYPVVLTVLNKQNGWRVWAARFSVAGCTTRKASACGHSSPRPIVYPGGMFWLSRKKFAGS